MTTTKKIHVPLRYIPMGLTKKDRRKQATMLRQSRKAYKRGEFVKRKSVGSFVSKKSQHILDAERIYKIRNLTINGELVKKTGCTRKALSDIVRKGEGAYFSSGSRPNQTAQSWGLARLASSITGGKAAAVDYNILEQGCNSRTSRAFRFAKKARAKYGYGHRGTRKTVLQGGKNGKKDDVYKEADAIIKRRNKENKSFINQYQYIDKLFPV